MRYILMLAVVLPRLTFAQYGESDNIRSNVTEQMPVDTVAQNCPVIDAVEFMGEGSVPDSMLILDISSENSPLVSSPEEGRAFGEKLREQMTEESKWREEHKFISKRLIVPTVLIVSGTIISRSGVLDLNVRDWRNENITSRQWHKIDNFTQYMPAAVALGLSFTNYNRWHSPGDLAITLASSYALTLAMVYGLKHFVYSPRPDNHGFGSFPSGHTATAFVGAHILFRESRGENLWVGILGYGVATTTGVMRVVNNRHWASDVLAGAGLGIFFAEAGYALLPMWHRIFKIVDCKTIGDNLTISPMMGYKNSTGLAIGFTF